MASNSDENELCQVPCFYGWVVLSAGTLGKIFSGPGQSPVIGVFIDTIIQTTGISRTVISTLYLFGTTGSATLQPWLGRQVDEHGPQKMVAIIASCLGVACFLVSMCTEWVLMLLSFFLLRFFGQGGMMLVSQTTINLWWVRRRGLIMGLGGAVAGMGMSGILPVIIRMLIASYGWRVTYRLLGVNSLLVVGPICYATFRGKPENYGLLPDGDSPGGALGGASSSSSSSSAQRKGKHLSKAGFAAIRTGDVEEDSSDLAKADADEDVPASPTDESEEASLRRQSGDHGVSSSSSSPVVEENWTRSEALRTRAFWVVATGMLLIAAIGTAFWFHLTSILHSLGIDSDAISAVYVVTSSVGVVFNIAGGYTVDKVSPRFVLAAALGFEALSMLCALLIGPAGPGMVYVCAIFQGACSGLMSNVGGVVYAMYYGREHLGAIQGVGSAMVVFGSALGPFPFALIKDTTGSYAAALWMGALLPGAWSVVALLYGGAPVRLHRPEVVLVHDDMGGMQMFGIGDPDED